MFPFPDTPGLRPQRERAFRPPCPSLPPVSHLNADRVSRLWELLTPCPVCVTLAISVLEMLGPDP